MNHRFESTSAKNNFVKNEFQTQRPILEKDKCVVVCKQSITVHLKTTIVNKPLRTLNS